MTKLGVIGTGTIASAIVKGLKSNPAFAGTISLSPRSASIASQLSAAYPLVTVARSNQEVLDLSDTVLLAVRPQVAEEVISALRFRPDHHVISVIAALSRERLGELVAPAQSIAKAIPLPPVAERRGITVVYSNDRVATELFNLLGAALPVEDESRYDALSAATAAVASFSMFADHVASWLNRHGIGELAARDYVIGLIGGVVEAAANSDESFAGIAESHATKGGLNEQLRMSLEQKGLFDAVGAGLDDILHRIEGQH